MKRILKRINKQKFLLVIIIGLLVYIGCVFNNDTKNKTFKLKINLFDANPVITLDHDNIYLVSGEEIKINSNIKYLKWETENEEIAYVHDGIIKGINIGTTTIKAKKRNSEAIVNVTVTNLIDAPKINNKKKYLECNRYNEEDAKMLDTLLEYRIKEAGLNTRAGAVAAARFLSLEFPYRIHYFYENGRLLTNGERNYVDGEGRYYHKGLYLNDNKKKDLLKSLKGPAIWGCSLYSITVKTTSANGLDCSGYVSWALYNAGFDVKDAGAGISQRKTNDLDDLGDKLKINEENLNSGKVKVGDLLSRNGHIGILIGMDEENYYIAEALEHDLHVLTMNKNDLINSNWQYIILMDKVYKEDGNLKNMW